MPVKITFEFDNPDELTAFLAQFSPSTRRDRQGSKRIFREQDIVALRLLSAAPGGLVTQQLSEALGVGPHCLPPIVNGWNRRARAYGLSLDDLVIRRSVTVDGKTATVYRLTERGKEQLTFEDGVREGDPNPDERGAAVGEPTGGRFAASDRISTSIPEAQEEHARRGMVRDRPLARARSAWNWREVPK